MAAQDGVPAPVMQLGDEARNALAGEADAAEQDATLDPLKCMICQGHAFRTAVLTVPCSHLFHKQCVDRALRYQTGDNQGRCPCCRQLLPSEGWLVDASLPLLQVLDSMKVKCPQGCGSGVQFDSLRNHFKSHCPATDFVCGWEGCTVIMKRDACGAHNEHCPHHAVTCAYCDKEMKRLERQEHEQQQCPHRPVLCPNQGCGAHVPFSGLEQHQFVCTGLVPVKVVVGMSQRIGVLEEAAQRRKNFKELQLLTIRNQQLEVEVACCRILGLKDAIEKQKIIILQRDAKLATQQRKLEEQEGSLAEQKGKLAEQKGKMEQQKGKLEEQKGKLEEQKGKLEEQKAKLEEQKAEIALQKRIAARWQLFTLTLICAAFAVCIMPWVQA